eukprot:761660-Hanusia_phi.AAC.1
MQGHDWIQPCVKMPQRYARNSLRASQSFSPSLKADYTLGAKKQGEEKPMSKVDYNTETEEYLKDLQTSLGVEFKDISILKQALSHPSTTMRRLESNQRLEFLGDAVLGCIISQKLYAECKDLDEGNLSLARQNLVSTNSLAEIAKLQGFDKLLSMSLKEEGHGGRQNIKILADLVEAILGAVFVDQGYTVACAVVENVFGEKIRMMGSQSLLRVGAITAIREFAAKHGLEVKFHVVQEGPQHAPKFTAHLSMNGHPLGWGTGRSSKDARYVMRMYCEEFLLTYDRLHRNMLSEFWKRRLHRRSKD